MKKFNKTCLEKFGVENPFQSIEIKEKIKLKNLEKYGVESHNSSDIVKENKKKSLLKKYGVDHYSKTIEFKNKLNGHTVNLDKYNKTCIKKYGVNHSSQNQEIKNKIIQTNRNTTKIKLLEKYKSYGIIDIDFDTKEYIGICEKGHKYRISYTCFKTRKRYNNEICTVCSPVKIFHKKENKTDFEIYKSKVNNISHKNKKKLIEIWDGYDYYDKQYIKENYKLNKNDMNYPNIDHQISIAYGFKNNIAIEIIGDINNLCITKCINNLKKGTRNLL